MKSLVSFLFTVLSSTIFSQFANNWIVGSNLGISFNTNPPTLFGGGICGNTDNSTAISNTAGVLQFYTDGMTVRCANNTTMPNGNGLTGSFTGGQCALIVPIPCQNGKYVIFHVTDFSNPGYLKYTVVDMSLNGGLGDVVVGQKNISLGTGWTEKLCAYYSTANNCYWVLSHKWGTDEFVAFRVDANSIATTSVVSAIGSVHNCGSVGAPHDAMGQLTISSDGSKIANALTCQDKYEVFNFNQNTGAVTGSSVTISGTGGKAWGTAFSPNSQKLYVNNIFGQNILQYDLSVFTNTAVMASQYVVNGTGTAGYYFGYMELAPNGKIFIPRPNSNWFSVVNSPDLNGVSCAFSYSAFSTGSLTAQWGTNRVAYNIPLNMGPGAFSLTSASSSASCNLSNGSATISPLPAGAYTYSWSPGNYSTAIVNNLPSGNYTVIVTSANCSSAVVSVNVGQQTANPFTLTGSSSNANCLGSNGSATITPSAPGTYTYSWLPGSYSTSIVNNLNAGIYTVTVSNQCYTANTQVTVSADPQVNFSITASTASASCPNAADGSATITPSAPGTYTFLWSPGAYSTSIVNTLNPGNYTVAVNNNSCGTSSMVLTIGSAGLTNTLSLNTNINNVLCSGQSSGGATITPANPMPVTYIWQPGSYTTQAVNGLPAGTYTVSVTGPSCYAGTSIFTISQPPAISLAITAPLEICREQTAVINSTVSGGVSPYNYFWSNGSNTSSINVGPLMTTIYTLTVVDANGCSSSALTTVSVVICTGNSLISSSSEDLHFYPNPFVSEVNFLSKRAVKEITFYNALGEKVISLDKPVSPLKPVELSNGIYFVRLNFEDGSSGNFKILKE